jgi:hypothetical protein
MIRQAISLVEGTKYLNDKTVRDMFNDKFVGSSAGSVYYLKGQDHISLAMNGGTEEINGVTYIKLTVETGWVITTLDLGSFGKGEISGYSKILVGLVNNKMDIKIIPKYSDRMYTKEENKRVKQSKLKKLFVRI